MGKPDWIKVGDCFRWEIKSPIGVVWLKYFGPNEEDSGMAKVEWIEFWGDNKYFEFNLHGSVNFYILTKERKVSPQRYKRAIKAVAELALKVLGGKQ